MKMKNLMVVAIALIACMVCNNVAVAAVPAGAILHVQGDAGVIETAGVVDTWQDQSGNGYHATRVDPAAGPATMSKSTRNFPAGVRDVVEFHKDGFFGFDAATVAALSLTELSVYAVVENTGVGRRNYLSNYSNSINWGWGYNLDLEGGIARSFTSDGTQAGSSDWAIGGVTPGLQMVTSTISLIGNQKKISVADENGVITSGINTVPGIGYDGTQGLSIGTLGALEIDFFYFEGAIAEIIVFPSVDIFQQIAVEDYLVNKYFIPEPMTMTLLGLGGLALIRRRRGQK